MVRLLLWVMLATMIQPDVVMATGAAANDADIQATQDQEPAKAGRFEALLYGIIQ